MTSRNVGLSVLSLFFVLAVHAAYASSHGEGAVQIDRVNLFGAHTLLTMSCPRDAEQCDVRKFDQGVVIVSKQVSWAKVDRIFVRHSQPACDVPRQGSRAKAVEPSSLSWLFRFGSCNSHGKAPLAAKEPLANAVMVLESELFALVEDSK